MCFPVYSGYVAGLRIQQGVKTMSSKKLIDFTDIAWPFNLLKSNLSIKQMQSGEELEIVIDDPDVLQSLILIINQSPGYLFKYTEEHDRYKLFIKKNG